MSLSNLRRLKDAWETAYPRQAQGGEVALAGFGFQFNEVLLASVRAWLAADVTQQGRPSVYSELLSDLAECKGDGTLVITQIKYTQSSGMVLGALEDLYRIFEVAHGISAELVAGLRFRILSARSGLKVVANTVERWKPANVVPDDLRLADFRARLSTEIHADAEDELLALLANAFRAERPLAIARRWMGDLLAAAGEKGGYAQVAQRIWDDLTSLSSARSMQKGAAVYVWTAADRAPEAVVKGRVLTGQQPQVHHLREGYFAPRTELACSLADRIVDWISAGRASSDDTLRLPLYWIGGRSGAGKSVMLLNVLALIHERGAAIVLFPSSVAQLPATVRWSRELHRRGGKLVVIALDDPYSPAAQVEAAALWRDAIEELHEVRQGGDRSSMPLIVCCGPSEQAERLRDEMADDVAVTIDPIPNEGVSDFESLRLWYRDRTGMDAPDVGNDNVLLVQMFFEWRVGESMREFAGRFRRRINLSDPTGVVETALARILAVNRIYAGANRSGIEAELSASLIDVLDRLRSDNHLADDPSPTRPGLWLAHPHLAEAIYSAWFPASALNARKGHLKDAILGAFNHGRTPSEQTAPIWALSQALDANGANSDLARRIDSDTAAKTLQEVYKACVGHGVSLTFAQLPVWIQIRRWLSADLLSPDPVAKAIAKLATAQADEMGLRLTCHKLLEHLDRFSKSDKDAAVAEIVGLLSRIPTWKEWSSVAEDAIARTHDGRLVALASQWVEMRIRWKSAQRLLLLLLDHVTSGDRLRNFALSELTESDLTEEWSRIAAHLLSSSEEPETEVIRWIEAHRLEAGIAFLLGHALRLKVVDSLAWCREWACRYHLEGNASWVLEPLWGCAATPETLEWATAWIKQRHPHSGFLMEQLVKADPGNPAIQDLAASWLDWTPASEGQWTFVWGACWRNSQNDAFERAGRKWLHSVGREHGSWAFVWRDLWKCAPESHELAGLGHQWLSKVPTNHGSWPFVLGDLWKSSPDNESLRRSAYAWLADAGAPPAAWRFVWDIAWEQASGKDQLVVLATEWLTARLDESVIWTFVWRNIWSHAPDDRLHELASSWLSQVSPEHGSWGFVWLELRKYERAEQELDRLACDWLARAPMEHGSWAYVWRDLWGRSKGDDELAVIGRDWLVRVSADHSSWKFVWEALRKYERTPDLDALASRWLTNVSPDHNGWRPVWDALWKATPEDAHLVDCACDWLTRVSSEHASWRYVWSVVHSANVRSTALARAGERWLKSASPGNPAWPFVWAEILDFRGTAQGLVGIGRQWLGSVAHEHASWAYVWADLRRLVPDDAELASLGRVWLSAVGASHRSWKYVWEDLWKLHPDRELQNVALTWLQAVSDQHPSWGYVWQAIWSVTHADKAQHRHAPTGASKPDAPSRDMDTGRDVLADSESLSRIAWEWLTTGPASHPSWVWIWNCLWSQSSVRKADLIALAREWLVDSPPLHRSWPHLWIFLWNRQYGNRRLLSMGRAWLAAVPAADGRKVRSAIQSYMQHARARM